MQSGEALWGTRSDGAEMFASLVETGTIGPSTIFRIIKLNPVVFPQASETLGVYVPTRRKGPKSADTSELKAAADRLASALSDVDEKELVREFREQRRRKTVSTK